MKARREWKCAAKAEPSGGVPLVVPGFGIGLAPVKRSSGEAGMAPIKKFEMYKGSV